ncbi:zinc-binding dehydrogenase [Streptomyces sp. NPDC059374]|uniref:zinc-binding dehydrogenase n=1 Tax=Streptomyces sp. NPDC059374 TaxID=3346814 RepID=UPI0036CF5D1B
MGGPALASSFETVRTCTGHAVSAPGRGHPCARTAAVRAATYSGELTPLPTLTGRGRQHHAKILSETANLVDEGAPRPLLDATRYTRTDVTDAHRAVENAHRRRQCRHRRGAVNPARTAFPVRPLTSTRDPSGRTRPFPPGARVCQRRGAAMDAR